MMLDSEDIEAIAERAAHRVVQMLDRPGERAHQLLDPKELARELSVSVNYVYAHAVDLGAMRLGDGPKARLRFDLRTAQRAMRERKQPPRPSPDAGKVEAPKRCRGAADTAPGATPGGNPDAPKPYIPTRSRALMGRPNSGEVTERPWKDGKTITFGARLYAYGRRHRLVFGTNLQGWNDTRAEIELESILQQVARGTWVPPEKKTSVKPSREVQPDGHQLFGPFARKVVDRKKRHGLANATIEDHEWRLGYLIAYFGRLELLEIDVSRVDDFRDELAKRSQVISDAATRGKPLMETVKGKGGKPHKRPKRPLANSSINKLLELLSLIMQRAVNYEYIPRNPVKVGERTERFLPTPKKARTFLEVDELLSLLDAAGELDRAVQRSHRIGRRGAIATLSLTGFRISELGAMTCSQIDLARALQDPGRQDREGRARGRDDALASRRATAPSRATHS